MDERIIDACAFHEWGGPKTLLPYLTEDWARLVERSGDQMGPMLVTSAWRNVHPQEGQLVGSGGKIVNPTGDGTNGSQLRGQGPGAGAEQLAEELFADGRRARVVLGYHDGLLATAGPLPYLARQIVRAVNDWTVEEWLEKDARLYGQVLVLTAIPSEAAAEIRRVGTHERMVAVALGANGLGHPFGHPAYDPIYEAAAELGLPLVLQAGSDSATDLATFPVALSLPATYAEYDIHGAQAPMSHLASMIMDGVFARFPSLRVLLVGGGGAWVPWCLWRLDYFSKMMRRVDTPWLDAAPSEYFCRHVRLSTYSLEAPRQPERLAQVLETVPGIESMLIYAGGRPRRDAEEPDEIAARLPESWHAGVFRENAEEFFRWPAAVAAAGAQRIPTRR
jgi:predicted TIM-barrel fold metal-dependent hydrolase